MKRCAFLLSADKSNSGKTTITIGIISALKNKGLSVAPFKCGPDYIDTMHLTKSASTCAYNLDSVFAQDNEIKEIFSKRLYDSDVGVIEGAMGYFDGIDYKTFKASSYDIASILSVPVILVLDASSSSFSISAVVKGIESLSDNAGIGGVILNNIVSPTHESMVVNAVLHHTNTEVLGVVYKDDSVKLPLRHLGVYTSFETDSSLYNKLGKLIEKNIDLDKLLSIGSINLNPTKQSKTLKFKKKAYVAYDKAFNFYYRHNLDVLNELGYEIVFFSPMENESFDDADFVYLGGGYPELFAEKLSLSDKTMKSITNHIESNKPLLAECGGMIYLTKGLYDDLQFHKFCGVFDAKCKMSKKREALGYVNVSGLGKLSNISAVGHEFHYSYLVDVNEEYVFKIKKLTSDNKKFDGFIKNSALASYTHFYFSKVNEWIFDFLGGVL